MNEERQAAKLALAGAEASAVAEQNSGAPLAKAIRKCADTRLRGRAHVDRVTNLSPLVKFFGIFRGHAHASAGSNG